MGIFGYESAAVARYQDANAFGRHSAVPYLTGRPQRTESMHVALHVLDTEPGGVPDPADVAEVVGVELFGAEVTARWVGGPAVTVDLSHVFWPWGSDATP